MEFREKNHGKIPLQNHNICWKVSKSLDENTSWESTSALSSIVSPSFHIETYYSKEVSELKKNINENLRQKIYSTDITIYDSFVVTYIASLYKKKGWIVDIVIGYINVSYPFLNDW